MKTWWNLRILWCFSYYFLPLLFGIGTVFALIGGTLMNMMGVYPANICYVSAEWWLVPLDQRPG
jgi:hypothetical protein